MKHKKQIIGILHNAYLLPGGEDQVVEAEYRLLKEDNYDVKLLLFKNPSNKVNQLLVYLISPFNFFSFFKTVRWLKKNQITTLHVHNWFYTASPAIFWAARYAKVSVVVTLHNYRMICPSGTLTLNGKSYNQSLNKGFSWQAVKDGVYRNSSVLSFILATTLWFHKLVGTWNIPKNYIVLTPHAIKVFQSSHLRYLLPNVIVKPNFVKAPNDSPTQRKSHFLFVGRLSEEKGVVMLLNTFKDLPYELHIIGDGPLAEQVKIAAKENIIYHGFKDKTFINEQLRECTALVFPSVWYETFGLILIEALALGTPVIAANIGSASYIIKDGYNGLHYEPGDAVALKEQLHKWTALAESDKARFRIQAIQSYQEAYTPEKNLNLLTGIYHD